MQRERKKCKEMRGNARKCEGIEAEGSPYSISSSLGSVGDAASTVRPRKSASTRGRRPRQRGYGRWLWKRAAAAGDANVTVAWPWASDSRSAATPSALHSCDLSVNEGISLILSVLIIAWCVPSWGGGGMGRTGWYYYMYECRVGWGGVMYIWDGMGWDGRGGTIWDGVELYGAVLQLSQTR